MQLALWKCWCVAIWCGFEYDFAGNEKPSWKIEEVVESSKGWFTIWKLKLSLELKSTPIINPIVKVVADMVCLEYFFLFSYSALQLKFQLWQENVQTPFRPIQGTYTNISTEMVAPLQGWVCVLKYFCADNLNIFVVENMGSAAGPKRERNIRIFAALAPTRNS